MSAEMTQSETYGWFCHECGEGGNEWSEDAEWIESLIAHHNAKNHA